jgi:hypothetical protein
MVQLVDGGGQLGFDGIEHSQDGKLRERGMQVEAGTAARTNKPVQFSIPPTTRLASFPRSPVTSA